jgi:hypothetical protein
MAFQKQVNEGQTLGFPGQFYDASVRRVTSYPNPGIETDAEAVGMVFTLDDTGVLHLGGDGKFAGILCHASSLGRPGLDASMAALAGETLELADMGRIIVTSQTAANPGDEVYYSCDTGAVAGTAADDGLILIPGARFALFGVTAGGPAVIQLDPGVMITVEVEAPAQGNS